MEPPDPIPNSEVKRLRADGSVALVHARVGHRQGLYPKGCSERNSPFSFDQINARNGLQQVIARGFIPRNPQLTLGVSFCFGAKRSQQQVIVSGLIQNPGSERSRGGFYFAPHSNRIAHAVR